MKYKNKQPSTIEAWQFGVGEEPEWYRKAVSDGKIIECHGESGCWVYSQDGKKYAGFADYIILGLDGVLSVCNPDIFENTYEAVY